MCTGDLVRFTCGHENRRYLDRCDDFGNEIMNALLPHHICGRKIRLRRQCHDCKREQRERERRENAEREGHETQAKALLQYFQGERPWPLPDEEVRDILAQRYALGSRLHPWLNREVEPFLNQCRNALTELYPEVARAEFQEMLDRQDEIERTGVYLADDRSYRLDLIFERALAESSNRRREEQRRWQQEEYDELRERELSLRAGELFPLGCEERTQALPEARQIESLEIAGLSERIRELHWAMYQPPNHGHDAPSNGIIQTPDLGRAVQAYIERTQEIAELRERIGVLQEAIDQRREEVIERLEARIQSIEASLQPEPQTNPIIEAEGQHVELRNGLYESDPEWLRNFDDWCRENSVAESALPEIDLRRDINGWFQQLYNSPSQARQDWIPFAETYRDAILEGDRYSYEYTPIPGPDQPLSFRQWCIQNADPREIRISTMSGIFIVLIQRYADYLSSSSLWDLYAFLNQRQERVTIMRHCLTLIPGAPLSLVEEYGEINDTPSSRLMIRNIRNLCTIGPTATDAETRQRAEEVGRFRSLQLEARQRAEELRRIHTLQRDAIAVRDGTLQRLIIERQEEAQREMHRRGSGSSQQSGSSGDSDDDESY